MFSDDAFSQKDSHVRPVLLPFNKYLRCICLRLAWSIYGRNEKLHLEQADLL